MSKETYYKKISTWNFKGKEKEKFILSMLGSLLLLVFAIFSCISEWIKLGIESCRLLCIGILFLLLGAQIPTIRRNFPKHEIKYEEIKK